MRTKETSILLFGNDQLHLETKNMLAIVHDFLYSCTKLTTYKSCKSVRACLNVFMRQAKKYML